MALETETRNIRESARYRNLMEQILYGNGHVRLSDIKEAVTTAEMSVLLQDGLRAIMFNEFAGYPTTWEQFVRRESSNKEQETWIEAGRLGTLQRLGEGEEYREARPELLAPINIRNFKYGDMLEITEEMLKFDRTGLIRQYAEDQGRRAAQTIEEEVYRALLASGSYSKTSADNDVGNNTAATTFSASGLITAFSTLATMKDPRSGRYLGIKPDTLIVGPSLEFAARQLLFSTSLYRTGRAGTTDAGPDVYGTGDNNVFRGMVRNLVVSPFVHQLGGQWQWVLCEARNFMVYQEVEPLQILQGIQQDATNEAYFRKDVFSYRVRVWFGTGIRDDRRAFLSTSSTAPTTA